MPVSTGGFQSPLCAGSSLHSIANSPAPATGLVEQPSIVSPEGGISRNPRSEVIAHCSAQSTRFQHMVVDILNFLSGGLRRQA